MDTGTQMPVRVYSIAILGGREGVVEDERAWVHMPWSVEMGENVILGSSMSSLFSFHDNSDQQDSAVCRHLPPTLSNWLLLSSIPNAETSNDDDPSASGYLYIFVLLSFAVCLPLHAALSPSIIVRSCMPRFRLFSPNLNPVLSSARAATAWAATAWAATTRLLRRP
jgi:hypothetical protein